MGELSAVLAKLPELWGSDLLLIAVCLGLSAFFSGSETVLTSISEAKARHLISSMGRRGRIIELWVKIPTRLVTTILVGNTIVNLYAAAKMATLTDRVFGLAGVTVGTFTLTGLVLVFGEVVPKTLARRHAEKLLVPVLHPLRIVYVALYYSGIVYLLSLLARRIAFGKDPIPAGPTVSEEEIEFLIDLGAREGTLAKEKEELFQSVIEFGEITAKEVMVPRTDMTAVPMDAGYEDLIEVISGAGHSRLPIYEDNVDNIVGIIHAKALLRAGPENFKVQDIARKPFFVPEGSLISELLKELKRRKQHMAIVVDEFGGTAGLVTLEDIIEELVGEIEDEYDAEVAAQIVEGPDGCLVADARATLREIEEHIDDELPDDGSYETLGGLVTTLAGCVPTTGAVLQTERFELTVLDADEKRVRKVRIGRLGEAEGANENYAGDGSADAGSEAVSASLAAAGK